MRTWLFGLLASIGLVAVFARERELGMPRDLHRERYVTSASCTRCHADHAASFARTFHRTMTREARGADVRAPFAGERVSYFGVPARMSTRDGVKLMHFGGGRVPEQTIEVALTVGSRRYQQYIGRVGDELVRLPWAYHLEEQRWFHMNGAFLTEDPQQPITEADYLRHVTRWNDNCIFCHNVAPNPGLTQSGRFNSRVEELGVACEACHGPASEHVELNRDPYRRYRLHLSTASDPTIVNPKRLSQERSLDLCGRCHGQRMTDDVSKFMRAGDPFVAGDDLSLYSSPLWRDSTLAGEGRFANRFWEDGTPRLTAYEYQGVLLSRCSAGGELTCLSCHDMHAGDPRGQLRPDLTRDQLCTQCHRELEQPSAQAAHSKHDSKVSCMDCHMPAIVYGVMASHPSHRIEVPDPRRDQERDRPDACTLCHVDRSRSWDKRDASSLSQAELQLLAGDPLTRALTAAQMGEPNLAGDDRERSTGLLLEVMERDPYAGVRHLAYRSLLARQPGLGDVFTPEAPPDERARAVTALRARLPHTRLDPQLLEAMRARATDRAIDIGE